MSTSRIERTATSAFTLIELLVVCAIIVIVTSIVLVNQNRFGGATQLQSFAYSVVLSIRQAQEYGISVQGSGCGTNPFTVPYGVHFDISNPTVYTLFADCNVNGKYDGKLLGDSDIYDFTITKNYTIQSLCVTPPGSGTCTAVQTVNVVFQRPEPDAKISWKDNNNVLHMCLTNGECATSATITLLSPLGGATRAVTVGNNGQISVLPI